MMVIQDARFIVSYTDKGKRVSYSKQFNSLFHKNNFINKMIREGYGDVTVEEKKKNIGTFHLTFKQSGESKSINKNFSTVKSKNSYINALKRNGCTDIKCILVEKTVTSGGGKVKYIPASDDAVTHFYSRTNKRSYYKEQ